MSCDGGDKDPPKPRYDPFQSPEDKSKGSACDKKCSSTENKDVCKKPESPPEKPPCPQSDKIINPPLKYKLKIPSGLLNKLTIPPELKNYIKSNMPDISIQRIKNIEYRKLLKAGFKELHIWIRENCDPKKMADKGSGAPSRPMKFPYTFSAKIAQFPLGHYVKNQWIWKYYVVAFVACMPIFYSINKLANSPGNVAKWAEIRRKEAAEHHH